MKSRSCLNDPTAPIVADTSVAINLNATRCSDAILGALPNRFVMPKEVALELAVGRQTNRKDADSLAVLVAKGRIEIVELGIVGLEHFTSLVSGPAKDTLDDGEAATIAYALEHDATALIDERKANGICASQYPGLAVGCTVDLLASDKIQAKLGRDRLANAVFCALYYGRMRVLAHHADWVVDLIGVERAARCRSLPRSVQLRLAQVGQRSKCLDEEGDRQPSN